MFLPNFLSLPLQSNLSVCCQPEPVSPRYRGSCPTRGAAGRFTGGGKEVDLATGTTITKGLELDCDLAGSNNLEISWSNATGTHQFHMEDFVQAICFLNPAFSPTPPAAPINTMHGVGTGRYDNVDGFTVLFSLEDHGEPGVSDKGCFRIYTTALPTSSPPPARPKRLPAIFWTSRWRQ